MRKIETSFCGLFAFALLTIASPLASSADPTPNVVGQFGFDYLHPAKAKCAAITPERAKTFKSCTYIGTDGPGSFTTKTDYTKCIVGPKSEFMIFKTLERCVDELETEKANGE